MDNRNTRNTKGSSLVELPGVLFVILIMLTFPLINLAAVGLRATFLFSAIRLAAHEAACASSFQAGNSSAIRAAQAILNSEQKSWNGIKTSALNVEILQTTVNSPFITKASNVPLDPSKIDTSKFLYQIQVSVKGNVSPLVDIGHGFFPSIPGLNSPMNLAVSHSEYCEHPTAMFQ